MIQEIYKLTDDKVNYIDCIKNENHLELFDDYFLELIKNPIYKNHILDNSEARKIYKKINERDTYKFVGEIFLRNDCNINFDKVNKSEFMKYLKGENNDKTKLIVNEENLIFKKFKISYGCGNEDPLKNSLFFKHKSNVIVKMNKDLYMMDRPKEFSEEILRVYVKRNDMFDSALETFKNFCYEIGLNNYNHHYTKRMSENKNPSTKQLNDFSKFNDSLQKKINQRLNKQEQKLKSKEENLKNTNSILNLNLNENGEN